MQKRISFLIGIVAIVVAIIAILVINYNKWFWVCGSSLFDSRDSQSYKTVSIGKQCWMQQNINVGKVIDGSKDQGTDCSSVQKYCHGNDEKNCNKYGGLYQWGQAMCYSKTPGAKGICPNGWHIPTNEELTILEHAVCNSEECVNDSSYINDNTTMRSFKDADEIAKLMSERGLLNGVLTGYRGADEPYFPNAGTGATFWSSSLIDNGPWYMEVSIANETIGRSPWDWKVGLSVRCLKN